MGVRVTGDENGFTTNLNWLVSIGEDVEEVSRRDEVEPWEGQPLGLKVLCQGLFTHCQPGEQIRVHSLKGYIICTYKHALMLNMYVYEYEHDKV